MFLKELKIELRRQGETHIQQAESAKALALTPAAQTQPPPLPQKNAVVNNPAVKIESKILNHNIWRCHLHLEKAIAFNQAAVEQVTDCMNLRASLSAHAAVQDSIILDSASTSRTRPTFKALILFPPQSMVPMELQYQF